jgi:hypothetical protein
MKLEPFLSKEEKSQKLYDGGYVKMVSFTSICILSVS